MGAGAQGSGDNPQGARPTPALLQATAHAAPGGSHHVPTERWHVSCSCVASVTHPKALCPLCDNKHVLPFVGHVPTAAEGSRTCVRRARSRRGARGTEALLHSPEHRAGSRPRDRCSCTRPSLSHDHRGRRCWAVSRIRGPDRRESCPRPWRSAPHGLLYGALPGKLIFTSNTGNRTVTGFASGGMELSVFPVPPPTTARTLDTTHRTHKAVTERAGGRYTSQGRCRPRRTRQYVP